jgi:flavodoxin
MKPLIIFYTRTGTTKKLAEDIAKVLKADTEEIFDTKKRSGIFGYLFGGRDAMRRRLTKIKPTKKDPGSYGVILVGTPIWGYNMAPAIRTYITANKAKFKKAAFFCTMGGSGGARAFQEMAFAAGKAPVATLELKNAEVKGNSRVDDVKKFCRQVRLSL